MWHLIIFLILTVDYNRITVNLNDIDVLVVTPPPPHTTPKVTGQAGYADVIHCMLSCVPTRATVEPLGVMGWVEVHSQTRLKGQVSVRQCCKSPSSVDRRYLFTVYRVDVPEVGPSLLTVKKRIFFQNTWVQNYYFNFGRKSVTRG